jgi:acetate kinase
MRDVILALNVGSSSVKFALYSVGRDTGGVAAVALHYRGEVADLHGEPKFTVKDARGQMLRDGPVDGATALFGQEDALALLLRWIESHEQGLRLIAVGHRIVHGGMRFSQPTLIDPEVMAYLEHLIPLAPLHQPHNLAAVHTLARTRPDVPQVACFDTAFHAMQPPVAQAFALPRAVTDLGVRRYGFHGLSYEYVAQALPGYLGAAADGRVVVAHLGAGDSMCALLNRRSVAATTGFTALDGLPMATRCGALDPGVVLYLIGERGMDVAQVADLLYHHSGLMGISDESGDVRELLHSRSAQATAALDVFVYRIGRELGSLVAALGGLDALVFTGGIGEHAAPIRQRVCHDAQWLGVRLDVAANKQGGPRISAGDSAVSAWVIPTDEDLMIARHTAQVLTGVALAAR